MKIKLQKKIGLVVFLVFSSAIADKLSPHHKLGVTLANDQKTTQSIADEKFVLHKISAVDSFLRRSDKKAKKIRLALSNVLVSREEAIVANAPEFFFEEFIKVESELMQIISVSLSDSRLDTLIDQKKIIQNFKTLEINSIIEENLGQAKANINKAQLEGAELLTPIMFFQVIETVKKAENFIQKHHDEAEAIEKISADAENQSYWLLTSERQARENLNANDVTFNRTETSFEAAQRLFTEDEAIIFEKDNLLILQLVGLEFSKGSAELKVEKISLLRKLQNVINNQPGQYVLIAGHTDSSGTRELNKQLSFERAESVEAYLNSRGRYEFDKFSLIGFADSMPVYSNSSKIGRAKNRRVDIIINTNKTY